jgi:outer membrane protein assembly factor BamB
MSTTKRTIALIGMLVVLSGCVGGHPTRWGHFHGDLSNQGSQLISSGFALSSSWISGPYPITSSSPVIGMDFQNKEVIYLGTIDARLLAVRSEDGSRKWVRFLGSGVDVERILSSPSVSDQGDIFVITNSQVGDGRLQSTLYKIDSFNDLKWSYRFEPGTFTTGSPKVCITGDETLVFVYLAVETLGDIQGELFVLRDDDDRAEVLDRKPLGACRYEQVEKASAREELSAHFKDAWNHFSVFPLAYHESGGGLPDRFVDPTVAVVAHREKPLIAIADNLCHIGAFEWDGSALSVLWEEEHRFHKHSSAAILTNGLMVFGREDGKVLAYDVGTGVKMWEYDAGQPVLATPATSQEPLIFVVSKSHIQVIHAAEGSLLMDDKLPRKLELLGQTHSSPAVTNNRVYLATAEMLTLSHDLKTRGHDTNFYGNGLASVAVGRDGAVYAIAADGTLRKYAGTK